MAKKAPKRPVTTRRRVVGKNPARQLGRVGDADWQLLKDAAAKAGKSFTCWAMDHLLPAAERELKRKGGAANG